MYPRLLSDIFERVYTFEPDPLNFYCLARNCEKSNIVKMQAAVGAKHEMIEVHQLTDQNVGMHRVSEAPGALIPQLCIDDLKLPACDLIMLDIEGYEIHALHGAVQTIAMHRPTIMIENSNAMTDELLARFGYKPIVFSKMDTIYVVI